MKTTTKVNPVLGPSEVVALAVGAMVGWGWIVMTGDWVIHAGSLGSIVAMLIGSLIIISIGLSYAELAAAMPQEGGAQVFTERALGRFASFICTWSLIVGYLSVIAFEAVALPTVFDFITTDYQKVYLWTVAGWDVYLTWVLVSMAGTAFVVVLNYFGVDYASLFQKVITALIIFAGLTMVAFSLFGGSVNNLMPFWASSSESSTTTTHSALTGMLPVLMLVPFMFLGFDVIPQTITEIKSEPKVIGKLIIVSLLLTSFFYCAIIFGVAMTIPREQLSIGMLAPPTAMTLLLNNPIAGMAMVFAGLAGIMTTWNALFIGGSRAICALAKKNMLPQFLAYVHPKYQTPTHAILLLGVLTLFVPLLGRQALLWFANSGSLAIVIAYFLVCLSFIILRQREPQLERPFRVRYGGIIGYAALIGSFGLVLMYLPFSPSALSIKEWVIWGIWMTIGLILYMKSSISQSQPHIQYKNSNSLQ